MSADSVMAELRRATGASHATVEALPAMVRLMAPDYSIGEYQHLLRQFRAVYRCIEPLILSSGECRAIAYAPRLPRIEGALNALKGDDSRAPDEQGSATVPLDTSARRWGCLYVIEGSILGGQVIRRHLKNALPGCADLTFEPWVPYETPGLQWRKFREGLGTALADGTQRQQAVESALATFLMFQDFLSRSP